MNPSWFELHGDKTLSLVVVVMLYLQGQPDLFAFSPDAPLICKWFAAIAAIGSLAHKAFFPSAPTLNAMYRRNINNASPNPQGGYPPSTPGNRQ